MKTNTVVALMALLTACSQTAEQPTTNVSHSEQPADLNDAPNAAVPDDRTPLAEPKGPIDPKSAEAAGQVVQHYGALIEQRRLAEAERLWNNPAAAAEFTAEWKHDREVHLEIGKLGEMGGAAGSIYITVPVTFYGRAFDGAPFRRPAIVNLRRVNDVPGSTEDQRRWHIESIVLIRMHPRA